MTLTRGKALAVVEAQAQGLTVEFYSGNTCFQVTRIAVYAADRYVTGLERLHVEGGRLWAECAGGVVIGWPIEEGSE